MIEFEADRTAPVFSEVVTDVAAPVQAVWAALTEVAKWPEFTPGITAAHLDGALVAGSVLRWTVNGMDVVTPLVMVEPLRRLVWRGSHATTHSWTLTSTDLGCRVSNAESLPAPFPGKTVEESRELLTKFLTAWNDAIQKRALA